MHFINAAPNRLSWQNACQALAKGHSLAKAEVKDVFVGEPAKGLLTRVATHEELGYGVKAVTVHFDNGIRQPSLPTVQGVFNLFDATTGSPELAIDGELLTSWKTASDSVFGAQLLARPDSKKLLVVGTGKQAEKLIEAYHEIFTGLDSIAVFGRNPEKAQQMVDKLDLPKLTVCDSLPSGAADADIICTATSSKTPVIEGDWVREGTHIDLVGAYTPDMREANDDLIAKSRLFTDCKDTSIDHIGEFLIPIKDGLISRSDILADYYDLVGGDHQGRVSDSEITLCKNAGGAHLDLMIARHLSDLC